MKPDNFLLAAGIVLATAFIFSCSDEKDDGCSMQENDDETYTMICGGDTTIVYLNINYSSEGITYIPVSSSSSSDVPSSSSSSDVLGSSSSSDVPSSSSSSDAPSSSSSMEQFAYCVYEEMRVCLDGPVTSCPGKGELSNECPDFTLPEFAFCVYNDLQTCIPGPIAECQAGGELSNECPFTRPDYTGETCTADYNNYATFRERAYYCSNGKLKKYGSVKDANNKIYKTIVIGSQSWMAENLNTYVEGSLCYDDLEANCNKYGRLYLWAEAMEVPDDCDYMGCGMFVMSLPETHKGICPQGWHLPTGNDWGALFRKVQNDNDLIYPTNNDLVASVAGRELKSRSGWPNPNDQYSNLDTYGFTALPGGVASGAKTFTGIGTSGQWWSFVHTYNTYITYIVMQQANSATFGRDLSGMPTNPNFNNIGSTSNINYYSVRCIQDYKEVP